MDKRQDYIKMTKRIVEHIYQGSDLPFSKNNISYIFPASLKSYVEDGEGIRLAVSQEGLGSIEHKEYKLVAKTDSMAVVTGHYSTIADRFFVTVVIDISSTKARIIHIHISNMEEERFYQVRDINERQFRIRESEIFYLEARHNHVLWNCENVQLETVGSFKETEKNMSEEFVRIHRGFIVNRQHVRKVARCYAQLDNGVILQIPVKRYMEVKKELQWQPSNHSSPNSVVRIGTA